MFGHTCALFRGISGAFGDGHRLARFRRWSFARRRRIPGGDGLSAVSIRLCWCG